MNAVRCASINEVELRRESVYLIYDGESVLAYYMQDQNVAVFMPKGAI